MIYKTKDGYVISDHGGWLSGVYDSEESAKLAFKNRGKEYWGFLPRLTDSVNVNEKRLITVNDIHQAVLNKDKK